MKRILSLIAMFAACVCAGYAQNADSLAFVSADWQIEKLPRGAVAKTARVDIFDSHQTVSIVKYRKNRFYTRLIMNNDLTPVGETASALSAVAAVNAGYWNVEEVHPSVYLRISGHDCSHTEPAELFRVNGIAVFGKKTFEVFRCDTTRYDYYATRYDNILASGPVLIDDGREVVYDDAGEPGFYKRRHPRTAIGCTSRGDIIMVVVDGRFKNDAEGVSIAELSAICRWLGMTEAINLDGGGSSTMWYGGRVVNHPCDNKKYDHEGARSVSSTLVVLK